MTTTQTRMVAAAALLWVTAFGVAESHARQRPFVPADMVRTTDIGEIRLSPDGRTILLTATTTMLEANRTNTRVLLLPAGGGEPVQVLQDGPTGPSTFRWSPDSTRIAFIGARDQGAAIWTYDVATKALTRVADYDRSNAFLSSTGETLAWSPDGTRLAFVGTTDPPPSRQSPIVVTRLQYKSRTTFADNRRSHVFVVSSAGGSPPLQVTKGHTDEHSIAWMADSRAIVFLSNREPDPDAFHNYDIYVVDVEGTQVGELTKTRGVEMSPRVSPDGQWIAFTATTRDLTTIDSAAEDPHLWVMPAAGGPARKLNESLDRRTGAFEWAADSQSIVFSSSTSGKTLLFRVPLAGGASTALFDRPAQVSGFSMAANGTMAFAMMSPTSPREVYRLDAAGREPVRLTSFNESLAREWRLSEPQTLSITADDGVEVEAWYYPAVGTSGKVPLLLNIHGGPHGMFGYAFDPMVQGYAGRGYAVLNVNPRGSSGYGQTFSDGSLNDWGGRDYRDLMQAVDHVAMAHPEVDADRLGVTGRSYGGYMTNWVITQTSRFKAAVSVASVANLISFYATSIYQDLVHSEFGGFPWDGDNYRRLWERSPLAHAARVTTPTLFVHGEVDNDVHVTEAEAMYMALRRRGIDAALARYQREGHAFREPQHRVDQLTRTLEWLDGYLKPNSPQTPQ